MEGPFDRVCRCGFAIAIICLEQLELTLPWPLPSADNPKADLVADGEVVGVEATVAGVRRTIRARRGVVLTAGGFFVLAWLADTPEFNEAFGFPGFEQAPAFLLFGLLSGTVTFWLSPLTNLLSRRHEYQADAFARDAVGGAAPMVGALRKLAQKNLSNLTPHPWYSAFHYSHPTIAEREKALAK